MNFVINIVVYKLGELSMNFEAPYQGCLAVMDTVYQQS